MLKLRNWLFIVTHHSPIFSYLRKLCRIPPLYVLNSCKAGESGGHDRIFAPEIFMVFQLTDQR
jgi:hypothetical protein